MKKAVLIIFSIAVLTTGCGNVDIIDTNYTYNAAIIEGVGEVKVKQWRDYDNSDSIQIISTDGKVYYTHLSNVILINKK